MASSKANQTRADRVRKRIEIESRRRTVEANFVAGATYREIAKALNVSPATVAADIKSILKAHQEHYVDDFERWTTLQRRRYDILLNAIWDRAKDGTSLAHLDRALMIMDKQNAITGLTARQRVDDWQLLAVEDIRAGRLTYEALEQAFDPDLATQLFAKAGVTPKVGG